MKTTACYVCFLMFALLLQSTKLKAGEFGIFSYREINGEVAITGCDASATIVSIPRTIDSLPVTEIWDVSSPGMIEVTLPDSINEIHNFAFSGCSNLISIRLPEGITAIRKRVFAGCRSLQNVELPSTVKTISSNVFEACVNLKSITIPEGVVSIGEEAFFDCSGLTSVSLPESVKFIGDIAFDGCSNLAFVTIPSKFHTSSEAIRLQLDKIWPEGFLTPSSVNQLSKQAEANAILVNGFVVGANIIEPGRGYTENPEVSIIGGGGSGALGTAVVENGELVRIEIVNTGRGYTSSPTFVIAPPVRTLETTIAIRLVPAITVAGEAGESVLIQTSDTANGPWKDWRRVQIDSRGTTEIDLDKGAVYKFYRVSR